MMKNQRDTSPPAHPKHFNPGEPVTDWFFWMFRQVYCWIKRGAQNGDRSFEKLYAAYGSLNEMRQVLMEMRRWSLATTGTLQDTDPVFASMLRETFPSLKPVDMLHATRSLLAAFEYACKDYCLRCETGFPNDKIQTVKNMLDVFDSLD